MHQFLKFILQRNSTCFGQFLCPSSGVFHCTHSDKHQEWISTLPITLAYINSARDEPHCRQRYHSRIRESGDMEGVMSDMRGKY
jgi:hypothetical protein